MTRFLRRLLRAVRRGAAAVHSSLLIAWYKCLYDGLTIGSGVRLRRGVHISVVQGAVLVIGDRVEIERDCQLVAEGTLSIGADSFVGTGSIIVAAERVIIGKDALIAAYVTIRDQDHKIGAGTPYHRKGLVTAPVEIGSNVWIGTKASVLRGVTIGNGAVIGAHSLVTAAVEGATLVAGVPAKLIKRLDEVAS